MSATAAPALAIDMGRGLGLHLSDEGDGRWKLAFSHGGTPAVAPALDAIAVEAIGRNGQCHAMRMFPGPARSEAYASGPTEKAYRARIAVSHGGHVHKRDIRLPGTADYPLAIGTQGGTLISMGHDSFIEVLPAGQDRLRILFFHKDVPVAAPPAADVKADVIGHPAEPDQVRDLVAVPGDDTHSLVLQGKVGDAGHLRLAVMMGDHYHTRCVPVTRP